MSSQLLDLFIQAFLDTFLMVGISAIIAFAAGLPLAIFLVVSAPGGIFPAPRWHRVVAMVVNGIRATPFIIILVALIPFTRALVGTSIGVWAAIVPLSVNLTPYFARVAEISLREVEGGLIEAAQAMGLRRWHIIRHVLVPEALPGLIGGATLTLVALLNASAVAGAVGAGGLGDLAIRYGYQRYDTTVMVYVIVLLIAIVSAIQFGGDALARRSNRR